MTSCFSGQMLSGDELREALISAAKPIEQTEVEKRVKKGLKLLRG
jgi:hypothetical protein